MTFRAPTVAELKAQRVIWITSRIEFMQSEAAALAREIAPLEQEKARLVEHLGYDPTHGQVPR